MSFGIALKLASTFIDDQLPGTSVEIAPVEVELQLLADIINDVL